MGTFLTQNVADVLSSQAFMNVAAAFPGPRARAFFRATRAEAEARVFTAGAGHGSGSEASVMTRPKWNQAQHLEHLFGDTDDIVDWEAVRVAPEDKIAELIKCRRVISQGDAQRLAALGLPSLLAGQSSVCYLSFRPPAFLTC